MSTLIISQKNIFDLNYKDHHFKKIKYHEFLELLKEKINKFNFKGSLNNYEIENINISLTSELFEKISAIDSKLESKYFPIITYHGTDNPSKVNSIIKYGYLLPGEIHPTKGYTLKMQNGNYYGDGIYSTTNFNLSEWFSFFDKYLNIEIIVNILFPGNINFINDENYNKDINYPIHGLFDSKYHHISTINSKVWVSASSEYIYPIATIKLKSTVDYSKTKTYLTLSSGKLFDLCKLERKLNKQHEVNMYHVFDDYYVIESPINDLKKIIIKHLFLIPPKLDIRKVSQINQFINSLEGTKILFTYDEEIRKYYINNTDSFKNNYSKLKLDSNDLFNKSLDNLLDHITRESQNNDTQNIIYLFIKSQIIMEEDIIKKYENICSIRSIKIKLIFLDKNIVKSQWWKLKYKLETDLTFENSSYMENHKFPEIFEQIIEEETKFIKTSFKIPYPNGIIGEGFLLNLAEQALWDIDTFSNTIIYKGQMLNTIKIDKEYYKTKFFEEIPKGKLSIFCENFIKLISRFRNFVFYDQSKLNLYLPVISILCEKMLLKIEDIIKSNEYSLNQLKSLFFQLNSLLNDISNFSKIKFSGKWYDKLISLKFNKKIVKRVKHNFDINTIKTQINHQILECSDALMYYDRKGFGISIQNTNASEINPWLIIIKYISIEKFNLNDVYTAKELNRCIMDYKNKKISDILILNNENDLDKMYLSYVYTRNPYLYIPNQHQALIITSWTYTLEKIFEKCYSNKINETEFDKLFETFLEISNNVPRLFKNEAINFGNNIKNNEEIECFLTESYQISSINQVLAFLMHPELKWIFEDKKYHRFSFALIAESIMRACRSYLRSKNLTYQDEIQNLLGMDISTNITTYKFDMERAIQLTNKFYRIRFTNSTPFAVVAILEYLERYHKMKSIKDIKNDFMEKTISMKNFLIKHMPNTDGKITQVALYLLGIKYHKSCNRQNIKFENPMSIIDDIIKEQLDIIKRRQEIQKQKNLILNKNYQKRLNEAQEYIIHHQNIKLFNWKEISEINYYRTDRLELTGSHLLKHHCCYKNCPQYLINFATENDIKNNTRHGLMNHLKYDHLVNNYVPSFHMMAKVFSHNSYEVFVDKMNTRFENNKYYKNLVNKEQILLNTWNQLNKL